MAKVKQLGLLTKDQEALMKLIKEGLTSGQGPLKDLFGSFDKKSFDENVSNPALKMFQEKILPQITEKFNAGGQALGSGQLNAEINAGKDFQSQLAQLMYQAQQQQSQNRLGGLQTALGRQSFENLYEQKEKKPSIWNSILPALGTAAGGLVGGPAGATVGNVAGKAIAG